MKFYRNGCPNTICGQRYTAQPEPESALDSRGGSHVSPCCGNGWRLGVLAVRIRPRMDSEFPHRNWPFLALAGLARNPFRVRGLCDPPQPLGQAETESACSPAGCGSRPRAREIEHLARGPHLSQDAPKFRLSPAAREQREESVLEWRNVWPPGCISNGGSRIKCL